MDKLKIAISGKSGCGNTTVSQIVAGKLGLRLINYTFKDMAREMGLDFEEFCRRAEADNKYDLFLDDKQVKLAAPGNCVLGSRLAIWLLKDAHLKVFLEASPLTRAKRISGREDITVEESCELTCARDARDRNRFIELYNIDNDNYGFADLIVDTEKGNQHYVADLIVQAVRARFPGKRQEF